MIEARGIATTVIGLVRTHLENTRVPRSVFVPFPLGRPLGQPEDAAFQHRVLGQALALLERRDGPVILEDFPDDSPSMTHTAGWRPQVVADRPERLPAAPDGWAKALADEIRRVMPHWEAAQHRFGRTTVGISGLPPDRWPGYAAQFLDGKIPESPVEGQSAAVTLRLAADDLKAMYFEAVQAIGPQPAPGQVNGWFWNETVAADALRALRAAALVSEHTGFKTAGSRFLVPAPFVQRG